MLEEVSRTKFCPNCGEVLVCIDKEPSKTPRYKCYLCKREYIDK